MWPTMSLHRPTCLSLSGWMTLYFTWRSSTVAFPPQHESTHPQQKDGGRFGDGGNPIDVKLPVKRTTVVEGDEQLRCIAGDWGTQRVVHRHLQLAVIGVVAVVIE